MYRFQTLLLACSGAVAIRLGRHVWQNILVFIFLLPLPCLLGFLAYAAGFWLHSIFLLTAVIPAVIGALILNYATEGKQGYLLHGLIIRCEVFARHYIAVNERFKRVHTVEYYHSFALAED